MEQLSKPKIKIVNIDNAANMVESEMERDIIEQNMMRKIKCYISRYTIKDKGITIVIMEVNASIPAYNREKNNRLLVGYQSCSV